MLEPLGLKKACGHFKARTLFSGENMDYQPNFDFATFSFAISTCFA